METRPQTRVRRSYVNFEPSSELVEEQGSDTLLLELSGFTKEQLKVQIDNSGNIKIGGERPLGDNKWSRFQKEFKVSSNCDTNSIRATFEDGILFVTMPKIITIQADDHRQDHNEPNVKAPWTKEHGEMESKHSPAKHAPPSQELEHKPAEWLPELEPLVNTQTGLPKDKGRHEEMDRETKSERKKNNGNDKDFYKMKNTSTTANGLLGKSNKQGVALLEKFKYKLGGLISSDSNQPRQSSANMVVGILVVVLVGMSVFYMLKNSGKFGNLEIKPEIEMC